MSRRECIVGIEIGTSKICVIVGEDGPEGGLKVCGVGEAPSRGVRKGEIVDFATAHQCLNDALNDAEEKTDTTINSVYVAVTGAHIDCCNQRAEIVLGTEAVEIQEEDVAEVELNAREFALPPGGVILHALTQRYFVDGRDGVLNPVGMLGCRLQVDMHFIRGVKARVQNTVRCVKEFELEVKGAVANSIASAHALLTRTQMGQGALVVDFGAGTTDFIAYVGGVPRLSGVLAVGGDHITNDISICLRIPIARAERLKIEEGSVSLGTALAGETILLRDEGGFAGREVDRRALNMIMHSRVRETLEKLRSKLDEAGCLHYLGAGVFLTGGCSHIDGIRSLAEEIFGVPVNSVRPAPVGGSDSVFNNPAYSTAIGLLKFARSSRPPGGRGTGLGRILDWLREMFGPQRDEREPDPPPQEEQGQDGDENGRDGGAAR